MPALSSVLRWLSICFIISTWLPTAVSAAEMYCGEANCYEVLGLDRSSFDPASLKKTYRKMSLQWHPDKNPDNVEEANLKFQLITTAYEVLKSPTLLEAYNYFLDHPEMTMYNKMNFYRASYAPSTPLWAVVLGLLLCVSFLQFFNNREQAKSFMKCPELVKLLESEYLANCTRGRQGYQSGELTKERKAEIRDEFIKELINNPDCPLYYSRWTQTLLPNLVLWWPLALVQWIRWRFENRHEIAAEQAQVAEEERQLKESLRRAEEDDKKDDEVKAEHKAENAKRLAERQQLEAEKKERWAREAREEAEKKAHAEESRSLIVEGNAISVSEMKKKGHILVEVVYEEDGEQERAQLVLVDRPLQEGSRVRIALEGATPPGRSDPVKRQKVGGEWSEGELLEVLAAVPTEAASSAAPDEEQEETSKADDVVDESVEAEGKARQRKKKKG